MPPGSSGEKNGHVEAATCGSSRPLMRRESAGASALCPGSTFRDAPAEIGVSTSKSTTRTPCRQTTLDASGEIKSR